MIRFTTDRFVQAIILTCVLGMSLGALSTSAQMSEAQFSRVMDEALTEQQVFGAMRGSAAVVVHVQGTASAALEVPASITLVSSGAADAANKDEKYSDHHQKRLSEN